MKDRGSDSRKRCMLIIFGGVLGAALIAWIVFLVGAFYNGTSERRKNGTTSDGIPEGYERVFRNTAQYKILTDGERVLVYSAEYDKCGRVLKENEFSTEGEITLSKTYEYDQSGRMIRNVSRKAEGSDNRITTTTRQYDAKGNMTEEVDKTTFSESDYESSTTKTWVYDDDGNCIRYEVRDVYPSREDSEYTVYYPDGTVKETKDSLSNDFYNEHGDIVKGINLINGIVVEYEYTYTADGRVAQKTGRSDAYGQITEYRYLYDEEGRFITDQYYNGAPKSEVIEYQDDRYRYREEYEFTDGGVRRLKEIRKTGLDNKYQQIDYYSKDGTIRSDSIKKWDEKGRILLRLAHDEDEISVWIENEYEDLPGSLQVNRETERFRDGSIHRWTETTTLPDGSEVGVIRWSSGNKAGKQFPDGKYGYYYELDEYNNPVKSINYSDGVETVTKVFEYEQFVIPKASGGQ